MRLVLDKLLMAERRSGPVKGNRYIVGFDVCQRFNEYRGKAKCCVDDFAFARCQIFWYCVKGAVYDGMPIYQYERFMFCLLF